MNWIIFLIILGFFIFIFIKKKLAKQSSQILEPKDQMLQLKTIPGEKPDGQYVKKFKTKIVGVTFENLDGSSRQTAIQNVKIGSRLQLAWNPSDPHDQNAILVFGKGSMSKLVGNSCLGHLKSDLATDVVKWINSNDLNGIYAEASKILGGTEDLPTYGCLIELTIY